MDKPKPNRMLSGNFNVFPFLLVQISLNMSIFSLLTTALPGNNRKNFETSQEFGIKSWILAGKALSGSI
ncbi:MAG: hypothetical protein ACOCUK_00830, partial [bacterium]